MAKRNGRVTNEIILERINNILTKLEKIEKKAENNEHVVDKQGYKIVKLETKQNIMWAIAGALGSAVIVIAIKLIGE